MTGLMAAVANHLWQSSLFAGAMWLLAIVLRKNSASVRYAVWMVASVKFLVPFALLVSLGGHFAWKAAPKIVQAPAAQVVEEIGQPFDWVEGPQEMSLAATSALQSGSGAPGSVVTPSVSSRARWIARLPEMLIGLWLCGVVLGLGSWRRWVLRMRDLRRSGTEMELGLPLPVLSSPIQMEPCVFGLLRPVMVLPEGIAERLTAAELDAVIAHELSHLRRRDNLTAAVHFLVETVFWFWPVLRWVRTRLMEERELACDEAVLRDARDPGVYAEGILKVCRFYLASEPTVAAGVSGSNLKRRIEVIVSYREALRMSVARKSVLAMVAVLAVCVPVVFGQMKAGPIASEVFADGQTVSALVNFAAPLQANAAGAVSEAEVEQKKMGTKEAASGGPVSVPGPELAGSRISGMEPRYPVDAKQAHAEGVVVLHAVISKEGEIQTLNVISGPELLRQGSLDAVKTWRYRPYLVRGKPVAVETTISVHFTMNGEPPSASESEASPALAQAGSDRLCRLQTEGNQGVSSESIVGTTFLRAGDPYDAAVVSRSFNALWNTGQFEKVQIERVDSSQCVQLVIHVREKAGSHLQHATGPLPSYEVATVKPVAESGGGMRSTAAFSGTIKFYIQRAFNIPLGSMNTQILGGPAWINSDRYAIAGKYSAEDAARMPTLPLQERLARIRLMQQSLLADRFKLKMHFETRELPVYELVAAKGGPKLTPTKVPPPGANGVPSSSANGPRPAMQIGFGTRRKDNGMTEFTANSMTLDFMLQFLLGRNGDGRPLVNKTGLTEEYDLKLEWPSQTTGDSGLPLGSDAPAIFTALEEQLGLKLVPAKGPVEVLVIDSIGRPSEN